MSTFEYTSRVEATPAEVFKWHTRPGAFERLSPPWMDVRVLERPASLTDGSRVTLQLRKGLLHATWILEHKDIDPPHQFADEQVKGPFRRWRHAHRFEPDAQNSCLVRDHIQYELPGGTAGESLAGGMIEQSLDRLFRYRHEQLRHDLARHRVSAGFPPQRIVVSGASGLIGSALCDFMTSGGHRVDRLVRAMPRPGTSDIHWQPAKGQIDTASLEGADVVVHLAGENLLGRWTQAKKKAILESRVEGTKFLCQALATLSRRPRVLVCASAVGYYGDHGRQVLTEDSPPGNDFLAGVCKAWEAAAEPARQAGIRVVHPRIGMVMAARGGALRAMLRPFRLGLGGTIGSGRQYISWIDIDDLLAALEWAMFSEGISGPMNAVSPQPVMQKDLAATLGKVLRRPAALNMPGSLLRLTLGELAEATLLSSQRAAPARLTATGFSFYWPDMEGCLRKQLGR